MERLKQMKDDSIFNMSQNRGVPVPPRLPASCEPSELYQIVQRHGHYPPLLQFNPWNLAVPFKELSHHRTPCQIIGSHFNLRAQDLNISKLRHKTCQRPPAGMSSPTLRGRRTATPKAGNSSSHTQLNASSQPKLLSKETPVYRPMSPTEQLDIMISQEKMLKTLEPTETDLKRYEYYINSVSSSMLVPQTPQQMRNIVSLLPAVNDKLNRTMQILRASLEEEVQRDYVFALKQSIVDYILMDPAERHRLSIASIPKPFPKRVILAPVPWAENFREARLWQGQHLFTVGRIMLSLQEAWINSFSSLRFVRLEELFSAGLPLLPSEFEALIQKQCTRTREELIQKWLPHCVSLFKSCDDLWLPLLSADKGMTSFRVVEFFNCAAALMSLQLRSLVVDSLEDLLYFFNIHKEGNDFGEVFSELQYTHPQVLLVKLQVDEPHITFQPSLDQCWQFIHGAFMGIIQSAKDIPRVESNLFPVMEDIYLHTVRADEMLVTDIIDKAKEVFEKNIVGPVKYLNVYQKYSSLLDNTAMQDMTDFLKEKHSLEGFSKKIDGIKRLWGEIASMRVTVPLSMFCLYAGKLNEDLCSRTDRLKDKITVFEVEENRDLNKTLCQKYEDISDTIRRIPECTEELVTLNQFIQTTSDVTVHKLREEIDEAHYRLVFLLDYAILSPDDIRLNSSVFQWPTVLQTELELSKKCLADMRDEAEGNLDTRLFEYAQKLQKINKDIQAFKKKEMMDLMAMKANVANLTQISAKLDAAITELEGINKEQTLLEREHSEFPLLQTLMVDKQTYELLWNTALRFQSMSEVWINGPFRNLNAETIANELDVMWGTMHTLTKALSELPGPCRVSKYFKSKIDQFKKHIPLLKTICNPGIKDHHWDLISAVVGVRVRPDENSSLLDMLDLGLSKFSTQLEEIGASASTL